MRRRLITILRLLGSNPQDLASLKTSPLSPLRASSSSCSRSMRCTKLRRRPPSIPPISIAFPPTWWRNLLRQPCHFLRPPHAGDRVPRSCPRDAEQQHRRPMSNQNSEPVHSPL